MKLGDVIKDNRTSLGMTMDDLADKSGLSKGYISMLEKFVENNCGGVKTTRQNCIKTPSLKSPI